MKLRKLRSIWGGIFTSAFDLCTKKKPQDFSASTSETGENVYLFNLVSKFISFGVYIQYFFDVVRTNFKQKISTGVHQEKIKSSW